jgi:energy-coupling factor transport system substrate-specific component
MTALALERRPGWLERRASDIALALTCLIGVVAFLYPFALAEAPSVAEGSAHEAEAPLIFALLVLCSMAVILVQVAGGQLNSRSIAALGALAALAAALRTISLPAGGTFFFFLVILGGYVHGVRFGFLLGSLSMFLSAIVTGGIGPWLPFQMYAAGWTGMGAGLLGHAAPAIARNRWLEVGALAAYGAASGLLFGAVMDLWFWPYIVAGEGDLTYRAGAGLAETARRFWSFYVFTSLGWDITRAVINAALILAFGRPLLRALKRYRLRLAA